MRFRELLTRASFCALLGIGNMVIAQPPGRGEGFGPGGPGRGMDMMRMLPVMIALDADGNGEISTDEMEKSVAALRALDKNEDGKLTADELRPTVGGPNGRGGFGRPDAGREPAETSQANDNKVLIERLMALDKDGDNRISKDEASGRMQEMIARADSNQDGFTSKEELEKLATTLGERAPGQPARGDSGRPDEARGGFGPPNPEQFIVRAFEFDADADGKLSKEELTKMMSTRPMGPRGDGGPNTRGSSGSPNGDKPQRPPSE